MEIIHYHFNTIDSTNAWAKEHIAEFDQDKLMLITADEQTAGRGRFNRHWLSPAGQNIYASFCFFIPTPYQDIANISQGLAVSAVRTLKEFGFATQIKWPNDLMIEGKKVGGILCETTPVGDNTCVIAGIGLNVNMPKDLLAQIDQPATSLMVEEGREFPLKQIMENLRDRFIPILDLGLV